MKTEHIEEIEKWIGTSDNAHTVAVINNYVITEKEYNGNRWYTMTTTNGNGKFYWNKDYTLEGAINFARSS